MKNMIIKMSRNGYVYDESLGKVVTKRFEDEQCDIIPDNNSLYEFGSACNIHDYVPLRLYHVNGIDFMEVINVGYYATPIILPAENLEDNMKFYYDRMLDYAGTIDEVELSSMDELYSKMEIHDHQRLNYADCTAKANGFELIFREPVKIKYLEDENSYISLYVNENMDILIFYDCDGILRRLSSPMGLFCFRQKKDDVYVDIYNGSYTKNGIDTSVDDISTSGRITHYINYLNSLGLKGVTSDEGNIICSGAGYRALVKAMKYVNDFREEHNLEKILIPDKLKASYDYYNED